MEYMEEKFIYQILLSKAILFCLMLLNEELDDVSTRVREFEGDNLSVIDRELEYVEELQQLVNNVTSELNRERLMNRLHHSTKVIKECFRVFSLLEAQQIVSEKINELEEIVNSKHNTVQNKLQNQQKRWILVLNALIGYQVAFTLRDQLIAFLDLSEDGTVANILSFLIWISLVLITIIAVVGLSKSYLKRRNVNREVN